MRSIGHRMASLDDFDALARDTMAVSRDDQPGERTGPQGLEGARHRRRCLAGPDHDRTAGNRGRYGWGDRAIGVGGGKGSVEQRA
jgi:hypothetical protein